MSAVDSSDESLVVKLLGFSNDGVLSGAVDMVVGGGFFWESSPFPIGAEASPSL